LEPERSHGIPWKGTQFLAGIEEQPPEAGKSHRIVAPGLDPLFPPVVVVGRSDVAALPENGFLAARQR
jgi:hypothetical protein